MKPEYAPYGLSCGWRNRCGWTNVLAGREGAATAHDSVASGYDGAALTMRAFLTIHNQHRRKEGASARILHQRCDNS